MRKVTRRRGSAHTHTKPRPSGAKKGKRRDTECEQKRGAYHRTRQSMQSFPCCVAPSLKLDVQIPTACFQTSLNRVSGVFVLSFPSCVATWSNEKTCCEHPAASLYSARTDVHCSAAVVRKGLVVKSFPDNLYCVITLTAGYYCSSSTVCSNPLFTNNDSRQPYRSAQRDFRCVINRKTTENQPAKDEEVEYERYDNIHQ